MVELSGTKRHVQTLTAALSVRSSATLLWLVFVIGLVVVTFVAGLPAFAQTVKRPPSVLLMMPEPAPASRMRTLQEVLVARLEELGVHVQLSALPPALPAVGEQSSEPLDVIAFIWLETQPELIVVHFYEAAGTNLRERRIPIVNLDAASIEEVAVVVRSAVSALLERSERIAQQGSTDDQEPEPDPVPPPPQAFPRANLEASEARALEAPEVTAHRRPLRLSLSYVGQDYAPGMRWNDGVALGVAWQADGWSVGASYAWFSTLEHQTDLVGFTLSRHPVEIFLGWSLPLWDRWLALRPEAAVGADYVVRKTVGSSEAFEPTARQGRWSWTGSGRVAVVAFPLPRWQVFVAGGADYVLNRFTYTVTGERDAPVITPRRLRPSFSGGLGFELP